MPEKIDVSDEEFEQELEALAIQSKQPLEEIRKRFDAGRWSGAEFAIASATRRPWNHLYRRSA